MSLYRNCLHNIGIIVSIESKQAQHLVLKFFLIESHKRSKLNEKLIPTILSKCRIQTFRQTTDSRHLVETPIPDILS